MARRRRYTASYRWDDRAWIVQFREVDVATFGRTLGSAKRFARSALAVHLEVDDLDMAGVDVIDDVLLPPDLLDAVASIARKRTEVDRLRSDVASATRRTAADLRKRGLSTRDVGEILGISGSRVAQLDRDRRDGG